MGSGDVKLLGVLAVVLGLYRWILPGEFRRLVALFFVGCAVGVPAQVVLGREINSYTSNIGLYVGYVSLAVIVTWGIGLSAIYALHIVVARAIGRRLGLGLYFACTVPLIIVIETVGSNIVRMKLHNYREYNSLMPALNAMHAPAWLYAYYGLIAVIFYWVVGLVKMHAVVAERRTAQ